MQYIVKISRIGPTIIKASIERLANIFYPGWNGSKWLKPHSQWKPIQTLASNHPKKSEPKSFLIFFKNSLPGFQDSRKKLEGLKVMTGKYHSSLICCHQLPPSSFLILSRLWRCLLCLSQSSKHFSLDDIHNLTSTSSCGWGRLSSVLARPLIRVRIQVKALSSKNNNQGNCRKFESRWWLRFHFLKTA